MFIGKAMTWTVIPLIAMILQGCGDTLTDLVNGEGGSSSATTNPTTGLSEEAAKFFSVFEGLDPTQDIEFSVAVFSFLSKDNLSVTNLKVKSFTPVAVGAEILQDNSIRFTQGFTSTVKLTQTLFCGKFVLNTLKILFCPGTVAPSDPGNKAMARTHTQTTSNKTLVAASKDIVIAGKSVLGLDNIDELITLIETSGTLEKEKSTQEPDNVETAFETTSGKKLGDTVSSAAASSEQLSTFISVSEIKSLSLSTGTNYVTAALTPVGTSGYISHSNIQLLTSLSGSGVENLFTVIEIAQPTSLAAGTSANLTSLMADTHSPSYSKILTSTQGQDIYILGDFFNNTLNLNFVTLSHLSYQNGVLQKGDKYGSSNPLAFSKNDFSMLRETTLVAADLIPGNNNTSLLMWGSDQDKNEMALHSIRNSDGVDNTIIAAEIENGSFRVVHLVPRFDTHGNRVILDASNHIYIAIDNLPSNTFGVIDCDSTSFDCAYEFRLAHSSLQARTDKSSSGAQLKYVTEVNQYVGQYLAAIETSYDLDTTPFYSYTFFTIINGEIGSQIRHDFGPSEKPLALYLSAQVTESKTYAYALVKNTSTLATHLRVFELSFK